MIARLLIALGGLLPASPLYAEKLSALVPAMTPPGNERRVALVIGNSAYKTSPLRNPVNDARAMARSLADTGFAVTLVEDASLAGMQRAIRMFGDELLRGGVGLFYFAGHGMQARSRNFLVPVSAEIEREDEIEFHAIDANLVLAKMDTARNSLNIMILDACRNNPFARSFRSLAQGLAQMDAPSGTLISFATAPGSVASDGEGENGVYTKHLLTAIRQPGLPVEQMFKQVRIGVSRDTGDKQVPWESSSLKGDFYFRAPDPSQGAAAQQAVIQRAVTDAVRAADERSAREKAVLEAEMRKLIAQLVLKQRAEVADEMKKQGAAPPDATGAAQAGAATVPPTTIAKQPATSVPATAPGALQESAVSPPTKPQQTQIAAISPSPDRPRLPDARLPQPGDRWRYRGRTIDQTNQVASPWIERPWVEVKAVADQMILEVQKDRGGKDFDVVREKGPAIVGLSQFVYLLSPYLHVQQTIREGDRWRELPIQKAGNCSTHPSYSCTFTARVAGMETVVVAAGSFEAFRVEVDQNVLISRSGSRRRQGVFWYAPAAKRYVKIVWKTLEGYWSDPNTEVELMAYKLN